MEDPEPIEDNESEPHLDLEDQSNTTELQEWNKNLNELGQE